MTTFVKANVGVEGNTVPVLLVAYGDTLREAVSNFHSSLKDLTDRNAGKWISLPDDEPLFYDGTHHTDTSYPHWQPVYFCHLGCGEPFTSHGDRLWHQDHHCPKVEWYVEIR
jgi:hypothetical protein